MPRDADALALAARQLMRITFGHFAPQSDIFQEIDTRASTCLRPSTILYT